MIRLQGVCARYDGKQVLSDISVSIKPGEFVALLGPNGSGKSTLLKILAGQIAPANGSVLLDEKLMDSYSPKQRSKRIAYFPQSRPIPDMDVGTLVSHGRFPLLGFGRVMRDEDREAVGRAITVTGLENMAGRELSTLSGGELQKAYLAMLIAQDSEILLLDEPGSFLDIRHQIGMMDILRELNRQGKTIVFAAHDLPLAFSFAKRILLLNDGGLFDDALPEKLAATGSIEQVFDLCIKRQDDDFLFPYALAPKDGEGR